MFTEKQASFNLAATGLPCLTEEAASSGSPRNLSLSLFPSLAGWLFPLWSFSADTRRDDSFSTSVHHWGRGKKRETFSHFDHQVPCNSSHKLLDRLWMSRTCWERATHFTHKCPCKHAPPTPWWGGGSWHNLTCLIIVWIREHKAYFPNKWLMSIETNSYDTIHHVCLLTWTYGKSCRSFALPRQTA